MSIAQSFKIPRPDDSGMFITSVDLFFQTKDPNLPVDVEIRPMYNGRPDSNQYLKDSQTSKNSSDVETSQNGSVPTKFTFQEPVYLSADARYAIVVKTNSEAYKLFVSTIDDYEDDSQQSLVTKQPYVETFFASNNNRDWTPNQFKDLKFVLRRAVFEQEGTVILKNRDLPPKRLYLDDGDGNTLNPNALSVEANSSDMKVLDSNHGFSIGDSVTISDATGFGGISASVINTTHEISNVDWSGYSFSIPNLVETNSRRFGGGIDINTTKNIKFDIFNPSIQTQNPKHTTINTSAKFISANSFSEKDKGYTRDRIFSNISLFEDNVLLSPRLIANKQLETDHIQGSRSSEIKIDLKSTSTFVSPVVDMQVASLLLINNVIDNQPKDDEGLLKPLTGVNVPIDYTSELNDLGSSASKHLTTPINIENPAESVKIILDANRPSVADFDVYIKTWNADSEKGTTWNLVELENRNKPESDENPNIFRTYEYIWGDDVNETTNFSNFQIKIVFKSTNSSKVPSIRSLRAIALLAI